MANGRPGGDGPDSTSRPKRGNVANESGLRALGSQVQGGSRSESLANESRLRQLGSQIDRTGARPRGYRRSGKRKWSGKRKVVTAVVAVVVLALVVVGGSWAYLQYRFDQFKKVSVASEKPIVPGQPFNMLVIGSDSRLGTTGFGSSSIVTGQRSDVIMIWHVDAQAKSISIMSIPRDTLVSMVGDDISQFGTFNRINSAYNTGPNDLVKTITANFGIPINHVVQVNFGGFQGSVNALNGVYLNFNYPAKDIWSGLNVAAGCQLLNGAQALSVARSRHYQYYANGYWQSDPSSDFGRIVRQDAFLKALVNAARSTLNPLKINAFLGSLPQGIVIDTQFSLGELLGLAATFHSYNASALGTQTFPTRSIGYVSPWGDVLFADQPAAQQLLVSTFGSELTAPTSPPPNTYLQTPQPPVVSATTTPGHAASPTTAAPATPPSYDPTPCAPA